jgi:phosphoketolase
VRVSLPPDANCLLSIAARELAAPRAAVER